MGPGPEQGTTLNSFADVKRSDWGKILLLGLSLAAIYYSTFSWLVLKDWNREDYTHCWLIPPIILYLLWDKQRDFFAAPIRPSWKGVALLVPGFLFFWLGELSGEFFTQYFSFTLVLIGVVWMILGWERLKQIFFPLAFTLAMYPPPNFLHNKLTFQLKLMSSELGIQMLHAYGLSAYREGNIIDLGFTQLQVVDACSGLRYLFSLAIMAFLFAYLFKDKMWKRVFLVLSSIPLTIGGNALRIALTGVLYQFWGPVVAEGFFHDFAGWFIFMVGLAAMMLEMWILSGFKRMRAWGLLSSPSSRSLEDQEEQAPDQHTAATPSASVWKVSRQYLTVFILLLGCLGADHFVSFNDTVPLAKKFDTFPEKVEGWHGQRDAMGQQFIDRLHFSDYILVNYTSPQGRLVNFYTAYYKSQTKGESIHSPETCLPGSGWVFEKSGIKEIPASASNGAPMRVNRAFMVKGENRQLSYYWFPQRDRILTNAYQLKWYNFWDALTRHRTDGALVRLITPVYPGETIKDADARLVAFTQTFNPVLHTFLPK